MLSVSLDHGHSMTLTEVGVLRLCPTRKYHDPDVSPKPSPTCWVQLFQTSTWLSETAFFPPHFSLVLSFMTGRCCGAQIKQNNIAQYPRTSYLSSYSMLSVVLAIVSISLEDLWGAPLPTPHISILTPTLCPTSDIDDRPVTSSDQETSQDLNSDLTPPDPLLPPHATTTPPAS